MKKLLLVGAFEPEIAPFYEHLPPDVVARSVGIGLVEAAVGTLRALAEIDADGLVFVGTAGAFSNSGLGLLEVAALAETSLADGSVALGRAAMVPTMASRLACDAALTAALAPTARRVKVATTLAITTDDATAAALERATGADLEHLEAFAVARAAAERGVPFMALFGVSNAVGAHGREQWLANNARASAAVRDALLPGLLAGSFRGLLRSQPLTTL